jgi:uncharacterized delta-60 repeat protein
MPFYVGNVISRAGECGGTGLLDTSFIDPNINNRVECIEIQADNKIVIGGIFTTVGGSTQNFISRLNYDGTRDTTFNIASQGTIGASSTVRALAIQPDQKIIAGGSFLQMRGVTKNNIARLNTDGSLDTTFNIGANLGVTPSGGGQGVYAIAVQPDGKIVIGGLFTSARGVVQNNIARLNTDGSLDTTFNIGANVGTSGQVRSVLIQPDGKIVIGGNFALARGVTQNDFARLETDGSLDTAFNVGVNPGVAGGLGVYDMALQPDGKIVLVGDWNSFRGTTLQSNSPEIARSNTDGTRDTTWATGQRPNNSVLCCELQYDGKVFTGGLFTTMRGVSNTYFARLQTNGTLDATYNVAPPAQGVTAAVPGGYVYCSALQDDCRILIGGAFTEVRGFTRTRLARLA